MVRWETPDDKARTLTGIWKTQCPKSNHDYAADLHVYAAHAHTAAAAAHHRGDHETAEELISRAQEYSMEAAEKTSTVARQTPEPTRA
jgi:hypothetical protein